MIIKLFPLTTSFASNKDVAQQVRLTQILPALAKNEEVVCDFTQVDG